MLQGQFPESKQNLPIILSEHIVCHLQQDNPRVWTTTTTRLPLPPRVRQLYTQMLTQDRGLDAKSLYTRLCSLIFNEVDYVEIITKHVFSLDSSSRCLIYTRSKAEAAEIAKQGLGLIGEYPDITKRHVVVSVTAGTYGLNDLVEFNTIVCRPPEPDKLGQMKGRLDRPGQKARSLSLRMVLLQDTVEEAHLMRLEMATHFYRKFILPLAEFYNAAVKCGANGISQGDDE